MIVLHLVYTYLGYASFRKISHALEIILKDAMLRNIFQIALCHGHLTMGDPANESATSSNKTNSATSKKIYFNSSDSSDNDEKESITKSPEPVIHYPNETELFQACKEQTSSLKNVNFTLLSRIEQRLCERFKVTRFEQLGHGTFCNYIAQNENQLFHADTQFKLSSFESNNTNIIDRISFEDLEQFILQTLDRFTDQKYIEQIVCYHFQVKSFEQFGHGSFHSVFNAIKQSKKSKNISIHYESILFDEIPVLKQQLTKSSTSCRDGKSFDLKKHN